MRRVGSFLRSAELENPTYNDIDDICIEHERSTRTYYMPCESSHPEATSLPRIQTTGIRERFYPYEAHKQFKKPFKLLAFYLPQFHPIPENDKFWGKGFTEWTNVAKAVPLFHGHHQPHLPIHNGFYDLRVVDVMIEQAKMARNYGIDGFVFYLYWFNGRFVMDKPLKMLLDHPEIDISYSLMWANENWSRRWDGSENDVLLAQNHSMSDSIGLMNSLIPFFQDKRYIKVDGSPVFMVYRPQIIPNIAKTVAIWSNVVKQCGFRGLYTIAAQALGLKDPRRFGFDAALQFPPHVTMATEVDRRAVSGLHTDFTGKIYNYGEMISHIYDQTWLSEFPIYPTAMMGWDNTARKGTRGNVYHNFTLTHFNRLIKYNALRLLEQRGISADARFAFINAWNEWAEGTHLEPDRKFGFGYLEAAYRAARDFSDAFNFIDSRKNSTHRQATRKNCVIVHAYYMHATAKLIQRIKLLDLTRFDVYVTTDSIPKAHAIKNALPQSMIMLVENRGRDMLPFIDVLQRIMHKDYDACLKVHSKETRYISGNHIGEHMMRALIPPSSVLNDVLRRFESDPSLGAVVPQHLVVELNARNMKFNCRHVLSMWRNMRLHLRGDVQLVFPAGSMYWFRPKALEKLLLLRSSSFEDECGRSDGEYAHAAERSIFVILQESGYNFEVM